MSGARLRTLAAVLAVSLLAGGCGVIPGGGGGGYHVTAYFTRTVSLFPGSQVRVLGLPAGSVNEVEVEGTLVRVELTIDDDVPVPADAQATIVPFSLIGERYVQLFPAYTEGPRLEDGAEIPVDRTSVPVEPDEALESLRDLLDDLNPDGTRRLTENLADDLEGQGEALNDAIRELAELTRDFGGSSENLGRIIDAFDELTSTLVTREAQLGSVLDDFAVVADVLADERDSIGRIVRNLARFATDAKDLVDEHGTRLAEDLEVVEHVAKAIEANLASVAQVLDAGPITASGLKAAYDAEDRVVNLRDNASLADGDGGASGSPGGEVGGAGGASSDAGGSDDPGAGGPDLPVPESPFRPLDDLIRDLIEAGEPLELSARGDARREHGAAERIAAGLGGFFSRIGGLARSVVGVAG